MAGTTTSAPAKGLLACGVIAGPLFIAVWPGPGAHPRRVRPRRTTRSACSASGDLGWIQIANFVVTGLAVRRVRGRDAAGAATRAGSAPGARVLIGAIGDRADHRRVSSSPTRVPASRRARRPERPSRSAGTASLHEVGFLLATLSWLAACFVFPRRFAARNQRGWVAACVAAPVAVLVVGAWPDLDSLSLRLVIGSAISFGFIAALAVRLMRAQPRRDAVTP